MRGEPRRRVWAAAVPAIILIAAASAMAAVAQDAPPSTETSVLDGVFTPSQASSGQKRFQQACASCHNVSEHTGRRFAAKWAGTTLGDLFDLLSTTMPEGDPGSLKPEEYAGILAFFLKESGYPEGERDLPSDLPSLKKIRIEPVAR